MKGFPIKPVYEKGCKFKATDPKHQGLPETNQRDNQKKERGQPPTQKWVLRDNTVLIQRDESGRTKEMLKPKNQASIKNGHSTAANVHTTDDGHQQHVAKPPNKQRPRG